MSKYPSFVSIKLPKESADSYYMKKTQHLVDNFIYIDPEWYERLFDPTTFYILGPKGSGKTLYAAYMCADERRNTLSRCHTISVDDYGKIIAMKENNQLAFTDYTTIWKVILLQKFLCGLDASDIVFWKRDKNFQAIQSTITSYFGYDVTKDDFNPVKIIDSYDKQAEVTNYLNSELKAGISVTPSTLSSTINGSTNEKIAEGASVSTESTASAYTDTWLRSINAFKQTLEKISFRRNHYLFIDGLDVRPPEIGIKEYGECIGALIRAVYDLNTNVFGSMNRKDGLEFKIIALTRTDIFLNSDLVNVTSCISDNCVELDWTYSNEKDFMYSKLYKMMNRVLGWDGSTYEMPSQIYLGFKLNGSKKRDISAAMHIQRLSRLRPRDIVVFLRLIQDECRARNIGNPTPHIITSSNVTNKYSSYYIEQVKSELRFSYSNTEIMLMLNLIQTIGYSHITESDFKKRFERYCCSVPQFRKSFPSHRKLIDLFYTLDVIGWSESQNGDYAMHWHYREIKAMDEQHRLPWEKFDYASNAKLVIHYGALKYITGTS